MRPAIPVLVLLLLAGCAGTGTGSDAGEPVVPVPTGVAEVNDAWTSCAAVGAPIPDEGRVAPTRRPRLGADFHATSVVVCDQISEKRADGGMDLVNIEGRATAKNGVAALVDAVRLPNAPPPKEENYGCALDGPAVTWFALVDDVGRWVRPGLPADACGGVRHEVANAVGKLTVRRVSTVPVRELVSAAAGATGCVQEWADMVWVTGQEQRQNPPPAVRENPLAAAPRVRVCVYGVPTSEQGGAKPVGRFERGGVLPQERRTVLTAAVTATIAAPSCATPASRFAVAHPADGTAGAIYVELDGCRRVLVEPAGGGGGAWLGTADATLIALVGNP
ncbi:hypothetical protein [Virgisporangium aurantiacum]|nr:hypothetical protein [Virgisporangium aurantiacum]